ncbi:MAG: YdeI/OmpD-associated family protein [Candidatus Cloacimonetes bacterium]|nr:YdeI/OmpD-associated family protein [Candidatus Cloacimonadota bacterium]
MENTLYVTTHQQWRKWLEENHATQNEIWLIYYKKHTGKPRISYENAVEEAICFGWIDSLIKKIDDEKYMQKYTPLNDNSVWSEINRKRAEKMMKERKMTPAGLKKIDTAKKNRKWKKAYSSTRKIEMLPELERALKTNETAWFNFNNFADSYKNMYIGWVSAAKREATRQRRIKEVVRRSEQNQKPGMM